MQCQEELLELLEIFGPHAPKWLLFQCYNVDWASSDVRRLCRRTLLQLSAGLCDVFELLMERPPYSLSALTDEKCTEEHKSNVIDVVLRIDADCLPLFMRRLLRKYPTKQDVAHVGPRIMSVWGNIPTAIDFAERSHALLKQAAKSSGAGTCLTATSNKVFCSQMVAGHCARGGLNPAGRDMPLHDLLDGRLGDSGGRAIAGVILYY